MHKTDGAIALVTGASSGIGLLTAQALRRAGYRVFGTSRKPMPDTADGIAMLVCDVTDDASVQNLVAEVLSRAGRIDLLVNNAGLGLTGGAEESSVAQVQALFDVNLFGVVRMTNAVLPSMRRHGKGRIINIGSVLGIIPAPYSAYYAATKHAIEGYSESPTTRSAPSIFASPSSNRHSSGPSSTRMASSRIPCWRNMIAHAPTWTLSSAT